MTFSKYVNILLTGSTYEQEWRLHVFSCSVRYNFRVKTMFEFSVIPFVLHRVHVLFLVCTSTVSNMMFVSHSVHVVLVTLRVPFVKQELLTLPEYLSSQRFFFGRGRGGGGSCCSVVNFLDNALQIAVCFALFLFATVLSVLLRFTASDYPFGISKLSFITLATLYLNGVSFKKKKKKLISIM